MVKQATLWASLAAIALGSPPGAQALQVTGFQEEATPARSIDRSRPTLTTVAVDGVNLEAGGSSASAPTEAAVVQLAAAHSDRLHAELVIGNFDEAIGDFSEARAHELLGNPSAISAVTDELAQMVASEGWDGINIDLESLEARDAAGLTRFVASLRAALGAAPTLSIDLSNATTAAQFAASGYDLRALGLAVNTVVLMGYDQHGPWERMPGPIGALPWQRAGLAVLKRYVPSSKIELGVAGYGYAWRPHSRPMLSDSEARALVRAHHAKPRYISALGEWTARLADGSTVWWSDARSWRRRVALARSEHLQGVAVWSLGLSDPLRSR